MAEILIVIRARVHELDAQAPAQYFEAANAALSEFPGYLGGGAWKDTLVYDQHFVVFSYESVEAAEEGLKRLTDIQPLIGTQVVGSNPADILRLSVIQSEGALRGHWDMASFLSFSLRVAEPGYGAELTEELQRVFAELRYIDGYMGSLIGQNDVLEEEIVGLVAWSSSSAFQSSLPTGLMMYEVRLFEKNG